MDCFYIYYRVDTLHHVTAKALVADIFAQVLKRCGVRGRLMQRGDDATTWMEVYDDVGDAENFGEALAEIVADSGLARFLADGRHVEHFRRQPTAAE